MRIGTTLKHAVQPQKLLHSSTRFVQGPLRSAAMRHPVELELEAVDCIQDAQLLQKANVSPFLTSARPPCTMLNDLDFSPQAISRGAEEISAAKSTTSHWSPPLNLDLSSSSTSSASSLFSNGGGSEMKHLVQSSSWQDFGFASLNQSPRRYHGNANHSETRGSSRNGSVLSHPYDHHRNDAFDCLSSLYDDEYSGRETNLQPLPFVIAKPTAPMRSHGFEKPHFFERHDSQISPFKDGYDAQSATALDRKIIVTDNDLKLFSCDPSAVGNMRGRTRHSESWESNDHPKFFTSIPRHRREKLFPQQNDNSFFAQQPNVSCSKIPQMIPFPAEPPTLASSEPKRHNALKRQSPLPDAHRTSKSARTSKDSPFSKLPQQSPMTEMTKKYSRSVSPPISDSYSMCSPSAQQLRRLPGLQLQSPEYRFGPHEYGNPAVFQRWHKSSSELPMQSHCSSTGYTGAFRVGFIAPTLYPPRSISTKKIGVYSPEARRERIKRFHEKRKERVFHKRIKYDCRKRLANACPRIKGRFVRKQDVIAAAAQSKTATPS